MNKQEHCVYTTWEDAWGANHLTLERSARTMPSGARGLAVREAKRLQRDVLVFCGGRLVASGKYDAATGKAAGRAV